MSSRINFICNGIFSTTLAGGDFHFMKLAEAAAREGYETCFFGGLAVQEVLAQHHLQGEVVLTDETRLGQVNAGSIGGQVALFRDFHGRYRRTLQLLDRIRPEDYVYSTSDYWFDAIPAVRSRAQRKLMVLHMRAPSFPEIVRRSRPDVDAKRLASLHFHLSQRWSLSAFQSTRLKRLLYVHPAMKPELSKMGFRDEELVFVSAGFDLKTAESLPPQAKLYDVAWIGRVHRQKGVDDLLATLAHLAKAAGDFRAVLIGNLEGQLRPRIEAMGLQKQVHFSGRVSEVEKFRLLKASRIFLMPSRYESWGAVTAEALAAGTAVVAYELPAYRPVFGDLLRYVPCFDTAAFQKAALEELQLTRSGTTRVDPSALRAFTHEHSWEATTGRFIQALRSFPPV